MTDHEKRVEAVAAEITSVGSLPGGTYADAFTVDIVPSARSEDTSPERWARAVFEGAPAPVRWLLAAGWRLGLGLRLGPRTPAYVLGWKIVERGPGWIVLGQGSRLLTAQIACRIDGDRLVQATFVRYEKPLARWVWGPASVFHRRIVPYLLERAAERQR